MQYLQSKLATAARAAAASGLALSMVVAAAFSAPADQGIHHEDWFHPSFGVLAEDLAEAAAAGKRMVIVWEQKGCIYCTEMHDVHLRDPKIVNYLKDNFLVVQLDFRGDRMVTDFDGEVLAEKALARKHRIATTPVIQFLADDPAAAKKEVARMPGLLKPGPYLAMFEFVRGKHYEKQDFQTFLRARDGS